ncbi:MAG UNVERIFIED_CONTAM: hypothetical protein LVT10_17815 [Anaerolineae bacterium]|jgi:hypothetical protein
MPKLRLTMQTWSRQMECQLFGYNVGAVSMKQSVAMVPDSCDLSFEKTAGTGNTTLFVVVAIQAYRMCWSKSYAGNMVKLTLSGDILPL